MGLLTCNFLTTIIVSLCLGPPRWWLLGRGGSPNDLGNGNLRNDNLRNDNLSNDNLRNESVRTYNLNAVISNCCNNFGPGQFPEKLIPTLIFNILNNRF